MKSGNSARKDHILITYDIHSNKRRTKIANELKNYGVRVQYSVFECQINTKQLNTLQKKIAKWVNEKEDSVRYYILCASCKGKIVIQGLGTVYEDEDFWII
jgi:CRISPR-associated protein Cas2